MVRRMKRLAIFARPPRAGQVKTRLSPALPAALACDLHRAMLDDTLETARHAGADQRFLYWAEARETADAVECADFAGRVQHGADLGERLAAAMTELLAGDARAVIVGTDCPALDRAALDAAFAALERHDLVLGPATDGGSYLIGLRREAPALFRDIAWSTPRVMDQTLARAHTERLSVHVLAVHDDLDTPADLVHHVARQLGAAPLTSPATDAALRAMGLLP